MEGALVQRASVDDPWEFGQELLGQGREPRSRAGLLASTLLLLLLRRQGRELCSLVELLTSTLHLNRASVGWSLCCGPWTHP